MVDTKTPMPREPLPPGKRIGRYELADRLAVGGMAEIFLACERGDFGLERMVVVKRILPHLAMHESFVEMFLQEAKFVARMSHPNVVQIYELGRSEAKHGEPEAFYIAMEYVSGVSVRELMRTAAVQDIEVPLDVCLSLIAQACAGAHAAHELKDNQGNPLGLVHRDISPHNLMVSYEGHVKLLDFGIAKATEVALENNTRTGAIKGKVHYMSPEQCKQEKLDRRTDIFSIGIIMWELLTARRLFKRQHDLESMQAIVTGDRWEVGEFREGLTKEIIEVSDRSLMTDRNARFTSADEMRRFIKGAAESANLKLGPDCIAAFLTKICKDRIQKDKRAVAQALERTMVHIQEHPFSESGKTTAARPSAKSETAHSMPGMHTPATGVSEPGASHLPHSMEQSLAEQSAVSYSAPQPAPSKRLWAASFAVLVVFGLLLWWGFSRGGPTQKPAIDPPIAQVEPEEKVVLSGAPIKFGFAPVVDGKMLLAEMEPIRRYLEKSTKRPFVFWVAESYGELSEALIEGATPFASLPPYLYLETKKREPKTEAIAFKVQDGSTGSDSVILVGERTGITSVAELKGRVFCYADPKSTSSYVLPLAYLKMQGIDPMKDLTLRRSGNHLQTLRDILSGACDAGATYSGAYLRAGENDVPVSRLRSIAIAGRSPHDVFCAGAGVSAEERSKVKDALLTFDVKRDTGNDTVGSMERVSGFSSATDRDFDALRAAYSVGVPEVGSDENNAPPPKKKSKKRRSPKKRKRR